MPRYNPRFDEGEHGGGSDDGASDSDSQDSSVDAPINNVVVDAASAASAASAAATTDDGGAVDSAPLATLQEEWEEESSEAGSPTKRGRRQVGRQVRPPPEIAEAPDAAAAGAVAVGGGRPPRPRSAKGMGIGRIAAGERPGSGSSHSSSDAASRPRSAGRPQSAGRITRRPVSAEPGMRRAADRPGSAGALARPGSAGAGLRFARPLSAKVRPSSASSRRTLSQRSLVSFEDEHSERPASSSPRPRSALSSLDGRIAAPIIANWRDDGVASKVDDMDDGAPAQLGAIPGDDDAGSVESDGDDASGEISGLLRATVIMASGLEPFGTASGQRTPCDPYCVLSVGMQERTTQMISRDTDPIWNETFEEPFYVGTRQQETLSVVVYDGGQKPAQFMGEATLALSELKLNRDEPRSLQLRRASGGTVHLQLFMHGTARPQEPPAVPPAARPAPEALEPFVRTSARPVRSRPLRPLEPFVQPGGAPEPASGRSSSVDSLSSDEALARAGDESMRETMREAEQERHPRVDSTAIVESAPVPPAVGSTALQELPANVRTDEKPSIRTVKIFLQASDGDQSNGIGLLQLHSAADTLAVVRSLVVDQIEGAPSVFSFVCEGMPISRRQEGMFVAYHLDQIELAPGAEPGSSHGGASPQHQRVAVSDGGSPSNVSTRSAPRSPARSPAKSSCAPRRQLKMAVWRDNHRQPFVVIEHCINCHEHVDAGHAETRYVDVGTRLATAVAAIGTKSLVNPFAPGQSQGAVSMFAKGRQYRFPDSTRLSPRVGSCEVSLVRFEAGQYTFQMLHSKLETTKWPNVREVCDLLKLLLGPKRATNEPPILPCGFRTDAARRPTTAPSLAQARPGTGSSHASANSAPHGAVGHWRPDALAAGHFVARSKATYGQAPAVADEEGVDDIDAELDWRNPEFFAAQDATSEVSEPEDFVLHDQLFPERHEGSNWSNWTMRQGAETTLAAREAAHTHVPVIGVAIRPRGRGVSAGNRGTRPRPAAKQRSAGPGTRAAKTTSRESPCETYTLSLNISHLKEGDAQRLLKSTEKTLRSSVPNRGLLSAHVTKSPEALRRKSAAKGRVAAGRPKRSAAAPPRRKWRPPPLSNETQRILRLDKAKPGRSRDGWTVGDPSKQRSSANGASLPHVLHQRNASAPARCKGKPRKPKGKAKKRLVAPKGKDMPLLAQKGIRSELWSMPLRFQHYYDADAALFY